MSRYVCRAGACRCGNGYTSSQNQGSCQGAPSRQSIYDHCTNDLAGAMHERVRTRRTTLEKACRLLDEGRCQPHPHSFSLGEADCGPPAVRDPTDCRSLGGCPAHSASPRKDGSGARSFEPFLLCRRRGLAANRWASRLVRVASFLENFRPHRLRLLRCANEDIGGWYAAGGIPVSKNPRDRRAKVVPAALSYRPLARHRVRSPRGFP